MKINIQKESYKKTKIADDGVTHKIDDKNYTMYVLEITGDYFIEDKEKVVKQIISDLKELTKDLENTLEKNRERED
jgi:hypothetical protein